MYDHQTGARRHGLARIRRFENTQQLAAGTLPAGALRCGRHGVACSKQHHDDEHDWGTGSKEDSCLTFG